ncbi:MAG: hypothetical protein Q8R07_04950 [Candidatus Uhrbacteria bacterium]|nr:hypothetical protein [Candidatus Uhrbacteria bacterium]
MKYTLTGPIPVIIKQGEGGEFIAYLEEANIAMSGDMALEATQNLIANILDVFDIYTSEEGNLGPEPTRQLRELRLYVRQSPEECQVQQPIFDGGARREKG